MKFHQDFKTWSSVSPENVMNFKSFFKAVVKKTSSAMMKLALMRTAIGKEDPELPTSLRNCGQNKFFTEWSNRHISTSTVQRRLRESGLHGRIAAKKPLLKDTNNKKRLAWAKKHEQWTLDWWKSVFWTDKSKFEITGSNCCVFVRCRVGEWMISACVVPTVKHGGMMVWGCFVGDTVIYLEFNAHLTSMATTAFCSNMPSHLVCA